MARQRNLIHKIGNEDKKRRNVKKPTVSKSPWKHFKIHYVASAVIAVILSFAVYIYLRNIRLQSLITTPFDAPKVIDESIQISKGFWGSYRPGVYFGMKSRSPNSPVMGLMWFAQERIGNRLPIRHWCEQGDGLPRYGWLEHDGSNFGVQEIEDVNHLITTTFVTSPGDNGGTWTARISSLPKREKAPPLSLLYYVALDGEGSLWPKLSGPLKHITGVTHSTGYFSLKITAEQSKVLDSHHLSTRSPGLHLLTNTVLHNLAYYTTEGSSGEGLIGLARNKGGDPRDEEDPNFVVYQVTVNGPFEMEVVYRSQENGNTDSEDLDGDRYSKRLEELRTQFDAKFQRVFGLRSKKYNESQVAFAKALLSNMLGGIGYFYGSSIVLGEYNKEPVKYWDAPLYTAVPSRSFFPRGFLWDEGFHNLLIGRWDRSITLDILGHWMDLLNVEGWIPREQILGDESRSKVPAEFVVQRNTNANPPTFFLTLRELLLRSTTIHGNHPDGDWSDNMRLLFPRLKAWFSWFNTTQVGKLAGSYRWRGRDPNDPKQLNPKTLTSGLDDYPRASHPTEDERHLDLRCWVTVASEVLADLANLAGEPNDEFLATYQYLKDNQLLDELHWSEELSTYADYGLHTDNVHLERPKPKEPVPPSVPKPDKVRVVDDQPRLRYVNAFGYNSIFPLILRILDPNSPKLGKILTSIRDPKLLWTNYGLRSLAKNSPLYMKHNTEHDPPYWRGAIWLNVNYLAVTSLAYYGTIEGPFKAQAKKLSQELRVNLVNNVYRVYKKSGYVWENYDDSTGEGKGCHPFTGWSALVLLIMAEE